MIQDSSSSDNPHSEFEEDKRPSGDGAVEVLVNDGVADRFTQISVVASEEDKKQHSTRNLMYDLSPRTGNAGQAFVYGSQEAIQNLNTANPENSGSSSTMQEIDEL